MLRNHRGAQPRLFDIAEGQQGFSPRSKPRLPVSPRTPTPIMCTSETGFASIVGSIGSHSFRRRNSQTLVKWALWSKNRDEMMEGVYSHAFET